MNIVMTMNAVTKSIRPKNPIINNYTESSISVNKVHASV